ncbi:MAG: hypothetical protein AB1458_00270 [Bacteroidota bacterium]|jgi:hypothetical protein
MEYIGKRISVVKKEDEVSIVISSAENKRGAWFMLFWLVCWIACGVIIMSEYGKTDNDNFRIFLIVFAGFWLYFFVRTLYAFLWKLWGREIIKIKEGKLFLRRAIKGRGKAHVYQFDFIKEPRVREMDYSSVITALSSADWLENRESLAFDYYGKEIRFGYRLKEEDAKALLRVVRHHLRRS